MSRNYPSNLCLTNLSNYDVPHINIAIFSINCCYKCKIKPNKSILERVGPIVEPIFADLLTKAGTGLDLNGRFVPLFLVFLEDDGHRVLLFLATLNFEEKVVQLFHLLHHVLPHCLPKVVDFYHFGVVQPLVLDYLVEVRPQLLDHGLHAP